MSSAALVLAVACVAWLLILDRAYRWYVDRAERLAWQKLFDEHMAAWDEIEAAERERRK